MSIESNILQVLERIDTARSHYNTKSAVSLEIAAKTQTADKCQIAAETLLKYGHTPILGHNHVQEARETHDAIRTVPGAQIHFIGSLQSNKISTALQCTDLVESVASLSLIEKLERRLIAVSSPLPIFLQVNVSREPSKSGILPEEFESFCTRVHTSPCLELCGLMTVGLNSLNEKDVRSGYAELRNLRTQATHLTGLSEESLALSMGMSRDLEWAIAEDATIVRVGTDIFGARQ